MKKYYLSFIALFLASLSCAVVIAGPTNITLHKQAGCMCCDAHADILEKQGFHVDVIAHRDLNRFKLANNVPPEFAGCHTMMVDGYIVEGHVPGEIIARLITEKPGIRGISLPGMPSGTPGMPGNRTEALDVYVITDGEITVYDSF
ncbi:MAG TPA: DUF411 domain-containing protein [Gammaproteobacteria bacterium]|nr:DUF411 domain-containing protein [Gammaproteobacteria bacterium]